MKIEEKHTQWEWYKAVWEKLGEKQFSEKYVLWKINVWHVVGDER